ncbi:MAG: hypothetical protein DRO00_10085, partial [Thermoproteota archaeon]
MLLRLVYNELEGNIGRLKRMPIVEGRYEAKISTVFSTVEEGIEEIKNRLLRSRKVRINNIPMKLLEELKPFLTDKDLKVILPFGEKPTEELKRLGDVATTKSRIYVDFKGKEANTGSILFSTVIFNVIWLGDEIYEVSTMEYSSCVKCMGRTFETAWRYS